MHDEQHILSIYPPTPPLPSLPLTLPTLSLLNLHPLPSPVSVSISALLQFLPNGKQLYHVAYPATVTVMFNSTSQHGNYPTIYTTLHPTTYSLPSFLSTSLLFSK